MLSKTLQVLIFMLPFKKQFQDLYKVLAFLYVKASCEEIC